MSTPGTHGNKLLTDEHFFIYEKPITYSLAALMRRVAKLYNKLQSQTNSLASSILNRILNEVLFQFQTVLCEIDHILYKDALTFSKLLRKVQVILKVLVCGA